jgi:hypothetical protein
MEDHTKGSSRLSPRRRDGWLSRAATFVASFLIAAAGLLGAGSATAQAQAVFQLQDKTNLPANTYQIYVVGVAAANSLVMQQDGTWIPAPPPVPPGSIATVHCYRFPQDIQTISIPPTIPPNPGFSGRVYLFVVTDTNKFSSCNPTTGTGLFNQGSAFTYTAINPINLTQPSPAWVVGQTFPAYSFLEPSSSLTNATIDVSQADMFAIPVDIQAPVMPGNPAEIGNPWGSAAFPNPNSVVNHASIKDSYTSFVQNLLAPVDCTATSKPVVCGYQDLLIDVTTGGPGSVDQYMIMNPGGYLGMNTATTQASPLNNAFDNVINTLWSSSGPTLALDTGSPQGGNPYNVPQDVLTSSYVEVTTLTGWPTMHALKFTGTSLSNNFIAYIFSPADYAAGCVPGGGIPAAYCSNPYSAGVQVFAGMGALGTAVLNGNNLYDLLLAANLLSLPAATNYGAVGYNSIVARLDLLISGAMNRGVTLVNCGSNPIWKCWQDETYWYPTQASATLFPDITQNLFSQWLHTATIGGIPMFVQPPNAVKSAGATPGTGSLMGMAYGFSNDENPTPQVYPLNPQPEVPSKMDQTIVFGSSGTYQVTLSPWVGAATSPTLQITKSGTGSGTVSSSPAGINCGTHCSQSFPTGTTVILTANSDASSVFNRWTGGGCSGGSTTCTLTLTALTTVNAEFDNQTTTDYKLEVFVSGAGSVSSPPNIDCGTTCSANFPAFTVVNLTATPAPGATFVGWSQGPCSGSAPTCQVTMSQAQEVSAAFKGVSQYTVTASVGTGGGVVTSNPAGIDCGTTCSAGFDAGSQVSLEAQPDRGYKFFGWAGACSGSNTCDLVMTSNRSVQATFSPVPPPPPQRYSLTVHDYGKGTVTSSPSGINCGSVCSAIFLQGVDVTLTAVAAPGYDFSGWGGACSGSGACVVKMNDTQSVKVTFTPAAAPVPALGQWGLLALTLLIVTAGWRRRA